MNTNLLAAIKQLTTDQGEGILADSKQVNARLSDIAAREPKPQRMAFVRCLMYGFQTDLKNTQAPGRVACKARLAQKLRDEEGMDQTLANDTLDLLEMVLFGSVSGIPKPAPRPVPQPAPIPAAPPPKPVPASIPANVPASNPPPGGSSIFCFNCGEKLEDGAKFCPKCGAMVDESTGVPARPIYQQPFQPQINTVPPPVYQQPAPPAPKRSGWQCFCDVVKKYAVFSGRARRAEYWFFVLFYNIFNIAALVLDNLLGFDPVLSGWAATYGGPLQFILMIALFLPGWGAVVRRFHDVDKRAWFALVPIYGIILLFYAGTPGPNRFGPDPKQSN
ncbi:hypothetical protein AGMMS49587_04800 [Spirochaetia bacterium]|nr:hypothetical protein AGMMS49587_04800 [Spirochaetia bacterium]